MYGAILGDIVGAPYEFTEKHRNAPKFIYGDIRCI